MAQKNIKSNAKSNVRSKKNNNSLCKKHVFTFNEIISMEQSLLTWYDKHQRKLPWREIAKYELDPDIRGYAIWVSEIMLQQTQVATVISYFNKWIQKWPNINKLANASLEAVNEMWAGLGYYSRARRLHEGAKILANKYNNQMPRTVKDLIELIPGIGLYTASAIASIAYEKSVGVVDGNVIRVLSRIRIIGCDVTKFNVRNHFWELANKIVSKERPGDFNQALMELGAIVCVPQNPKCKMCPVKDICHAYLMTKTNEDQKIKFKITCKGRKKENNTLNDKTDLFDIENAYCKFCLPSESWKANPQVTIFPLKPKKKKSRLETVGVVVIEKNQKVLLTQRPEKGLLAGLWEFPSVILQENIYTPTENKEINEMLLKAGLKETDLTAKKYIGKVIHVFSHITTTYIVEHLVLNKNSKFKEKLAQSKWVTREEINSTAISTAMKKVLASVDKSQKSEQTKHNRKRKNSKDNTKQTSIKLFFPG